MKKILLTLSLVIAMSATGFAATTIGDWGTEGTGPDYEGTQASTADVGKSANGIVWSRHNLSSYGEHYQATTSVEGTSTATGIEPLSVITTEICVFCHTPHFGRTDTAPMWNRGTAATAYIAYGTNGPGVANAVGKTLAGTATGVGGSSLACLSCHDGVTTLDNLINAPGKGSRTNGTGADAGWVFGEVGNYIGDTANYGDTTEANILANGKATSRLNIGAGASGVRDAANVDLTNDHPISVVYNGENTLDPNGPRASLRDKATTISDISILNARMNYGDSISHGLDEGSPSGYFGRSDNLWASRGYISDQATIEELLRDAGGQVQCATCHDPHYKNQTNTDPAVVCAYFKGKSKWGAEYTNEEETPSYEGCISASTAGTVIPTVSGITYGTLTVGDMTAYNEHYLTDVDSDGLFLRRVGGNSNSGVCRTCHNK